MKKFSATVISMILCLTLPACANSDTSSNAETGKNSNSFESIMNESVASIGEESNGDDRVRTVCFYNDEKYTQPPYDDAYKQIQCDDYDKAIKDFLDEYYTNPDGNEEYRQDYLPVPDAYAPIVGTIEKSDVKKQLKIEYADICAWQTSYYYSIDGKGVYVDFAKEEDCGSSKDAASLVYKDKFVTPENLTESVTDQFGYSEIGNIVNGCTVTYGFDNSERVTAKVEIYVDGYYIGIGRMLQSDAKLPDFLFDEKQLSDFIDNLKYAINNEMVIYRS